MTDLSNFAMPTDVEEVSTDSLGAGVWDTGAYPTTIDMAYMSESAGGATAVNLLFTSDKGQSLRQTIYITNKKGEPFYIDKRSGKKKPLPGYNTVNNICLLASGLELAKLATEKKIVKIYDFDQRKEVPTEVPVIMDLLKKPVTLAVQKQIVDKNVKDSNGNYVPSGETREENEIVNSFKDGSNFTVDEIKAKASEAEFMVKWVTKNKGKVRNRAKGGSGGAQTGAPVKPAAEDLFS